MVSAVQVPSPRSDASPALSQVFVCESVSNRNVPVDLLEIVAAIKARQRAGTGTITLTYPRHTGRVVIRGGRIVAVSSTPVLGASSDVAREDLREQLGMLLGEDAVGINIDAISHGAVDEAVVGWTLEELLRN